MKRFFAILLTLSLAIVVVVLGFLGTMMLDSMPELIALVVVGVLVALYGLVRFYGWLCRRMDLRWPV